MLKIIILFGILALSAAASINGRQLADEEEKKEPIAIVKSEEHHQNDGSFSFVYEGADGSFREETGRVINPGTDEQTIEITGSYRYYDADGQLIEVRYTAGKNGFVPVGGNVPAEISIAAQLAADAAFNEQTTEVETHPHRAK